MGGGEGSHGDGVVASGATRPPWWRFWPGSEKPHQSPDGPAAANNGRKSRTEAQAATGIPWLVDVMTGR